MPSSTTTRILVLVAAALTLLACRVVFTLDEGRELAFSPDGIQFERADQVSGADAPGPTSAAPAAPSTGPEADEAEESIGIPSATPQRETDQVYSTVDRPDDVNGYQVHFIWRVYPNAK